MKKLSLRKAQDSDIDLIFAWANERECRKNSFSNKPIAYAEHTKWFFKVMQDPNELFYILMREESPIGQIRISITSEGAIISYSIDVTSRGHGYGKSLLLLMEKEIKKERPENHILIGRVKKDNFTSQRKFEEIGYQKFERNDYYEYIKEI